ncbi:hypothetical protein BH11ACT1_BH11ACT1_25010 [soil metagenome]
MAPLHRAELRRSKIELVAGWAPSQPWFEANVDVDVPSAVLTGTWSGHLEPRPLVLVLAP